MQLRTLVLAAGLALALAGGATGQEEEPAKPRGAAARAAPAKPSVDIAAFLKQLSEAQRGLSDQMQQQKERMDWFHGELTAQQDRLAAVEQELKAMRDEVKGLYVESSAVKQAIDGLKEDIGERELQRLGVPHLLGILHRGDDPAARRDLRAEHPALSSLAAHRHPSAKARTSSTYSTAAVWWMKCPMLRPRRRRVGGRERRARRRRRGTLTSPLGKLCVSRRDVVEAGRVARRREGADG